MLQVDSDVKRHLLRTLPHNLDAETSVLGTALVHHRMPIGANLQPEHFIYAEHSALWDAILKARSEDNPIDGIAATTIISNDHRFPNKQLISQLIQCASVPINAEQYAALIIDLYLKRQLITISEDITNTVYDADVGETADVILQKAQTELSGLKERASSQTDDIFGVSGNDLMKMKFRPLPQFVKDLIVPGLTLLVAKPKVGKSWMLLDIGLGVAEGGVALGSLNCLQSEVLLIMLEDSYRRLKSRMSKLLGEQRLPAGITFNTSWRKGRRAVEDLERYLDKRPRTRLVGIDILAKVKEASQGNGSIYIDDYETLSIYQRLASERDIAIIILHHARKAAGDDLDVISGTYGLAGAADHCVLINGTKDNGYQLSMTGRDLLPIDWDVALNDGQWNILGDRKPKNKHLDTVDRIQRNTTIKKLASEGWTQREIAQKLGCSVSTVNEILKSHAPNA